MATETQLKKNISDIKAGIRSKATDSKTKDKLKFQLNRLTKELEDLKKTPATKTKTTATKQKTQTALQKLKAFIKSNEKLKGYKGSGIDIEKDAGRPALPLGKRISKNGNTYTENRLNRADVKQPAKKYPKLENGGELKKKK